MRTIEILAVVVLLIGLALSIGKYYTTPKCQDNFF